MFFERWVVDARRLSSRSKYLNHSKKPNCDVKVVVVNGDHRIRFAAKKYIKAGEELTFDYGYTDDTAPPWMNKTRE